MKQILKLKQWFRVYNNTFNKTLSIIKQNGIQALNFEKLRTLLVTCNTKTNHPDYKRISNEKIQLYRMLDVLLKDKELHKQEILETKILIVDKTRELLDFAKTIKSVKNPNVDDFELEVPKDVRSEAVDDVCKAYKTCLTNLKEGTIKTFDIFYKNNQSQDKCLAITKKLIKFKKSTNVHKIVINSMGPSCKIFNISKRMSKQISLENIEITNTCRLTKTNGYYYLHVPVKEFIITTEIKEKEIRYGGIDPGLRTFMTVYKPSYCTEYNFNLWYIDNINKKMDKIKHKKKVKNRYKKLIKYEIQKKNHINQLHWLTIKHLLDNNNVIFYGDINSHNIVKNNPNHKLNQHVNDLKFYQFKQRLLYKSILRNKFVIPIKENYTTKTCSSCGHQNEVGSSKIFNCNGCKITIGRDLNASKNILLKGLVITGVL